MGRQPAGSDVTAALGAAHVMHRTGVAAFGFKNRRGQCTSFNGRTDIACHPQGQFAQRGVDLNGLASPDLAVKQRPLLDYPACHLFQTQHLRAELHFIGAVGL